MFDVKDLQAESRLARMSGSDCPVVSKERLDATVAEFEGMTIGQLRRRPIPWSLVDASARGAAFRALSAVAGRRQWGQSVGDSQL
mgnify:FL=1